MGQGQFLWFFKVPGWFFMVSDRFLCVLKFQVDFSWLQVSFYGSRLVLHDSSWAFMIFHDSRLVFHESSWVLIIFHDSRLVFMRFQTGFYGSSSLFMGSKVPS